VIREETMLAGGVLLFSFFVNNKIIQEKRKRYKKNTVLQKTTQ
jgi:hypothetical protein